MDNLYYISYIQNVEKYSVKPVFQYDTGVFLYLSGIPSTAIVQMHYSIEGMRNAFIYIPEFKEDYWVSKIPNAFIAQSKSIQIYVHISFEDGGKTIMHITMPIKARPKPDSYEFTEEELQGFDYLMRQLNSALQETNEATEEASEAAQSATDAAKEATEVIETATEVIETIPKTIQEILDENSYIKTINNQMPDENGNIQIDTGTGNVQSINGEQPDENGNVVLNLEDIYFHDDEEDTSGEETIVTLPIIADQASNALKLGGVEADQYALKNDVVMSVNNIAADENGNVQLDAEDVGARPENWTPTAADVGALAAGGTAVNAAKFDGKAPEAYTAVQLLDNSDWRIKDNIINQRGKTVYDKDAVDFYTIDRWSRGGKELTVTINSGYITLTNTSTGNIIFVQTQKNVYTGKRLTFAVELISGEIYTCTGTCSIPESGLVVFGLVYIGNSILRMIAYADGTVTFEIVVAPSAVLSIKGAALYEGTYTADTLPPFVPTHPRVENLKLGNAVQPRNLLDNTDFAIAQAGYGGMHGNAAYAADRWPAINISEYVYNDGVFKLTPTGNGYIYQNVDLAKLKGTAYTLSVKVRNGYLSVRVSTQSGIVNAAEATAGSEWRTIIVPFAVNPASTTLLQCQFYLKNSSSAEITEPVLYIGTYTAETLPPFVPPDYAAELLKCQQYCVLLSSGATYLIGMSGGGTGNNARLFVPLPIQMRKAPTINAFACSVITPNGSVSNMTYTPSNVLVQPNGLFIHGTFSERPSAEFTYITVTVMPTVDIALNVEP